MADLDAVLAELEGIQTGGLLSCECPNYRTIAVVYTVNTDAGRYVPSIVRCPHFRGSNACKSGTWGGK